MNFLEERSIVAGVKGEDVIVPREEKRKGRMNSINILPKWA